MDIGVNLTHTSFREDLDAVLARRRRSHDRRDRHFDRRKHARECNERTIPALRAIASNPRVVAIGERGPDFNRNYSPHPDPEKWSKAQLEFAIELGKPLFHHSRDAHPRFAEVLRAYLDLGPM